MGHTGSSVSGNIFSRQPVNNRGRGQEWSPLHRRGVEVGKKRAPTAARSTRRASRITYPLRAGYKRVAFLHAWRENNGAGARKLLLSLSPLPPISGYRLSFCRTIVPCKPLSKQNGRCSEGP